MDAKALNNLVGKPFIDGARGPDFYDCWGLAMAAMRCFGYNLPEFHVSAFDTGAVAVAIESEKLLWHELPVPVPGSIVVMRFGSSVINHVATFIGNGFVLHTREKTGSVIERINTPVLRHLVRGYFLPPEAYKA